MSRIDIENIKSGIYYDMKNENEFPFNTILEIILEKKNIEEKISPIEKEVYIFKIGVIFGEGYFRIKDNYKNHFFVIYEDKIENCHYFAFLNKIDKTEKDYNNSVIYHKNMKSYEEYKAEKISNKLEEKNA